MTQTTRSANEFSPLTTTSFKSDPPLGRVPQPLTHTDAGHRHCRIVSISAHPSYCPSPQVNGMRVDDLVAIWEQNPERQSALANARQWVADTFYSDGGDTVRTLRLRKGWSQARLAEALGTSQSHVARIERGRENLAIKTCRRLCEALEITLDGLDQALRRQESLANTRRNSKSRAHQKVRAKPRMPKKIP